jgi:hypothetical protein
MLNNATLEQMEALAQLKGGREWNTIREYLTECRESLIDQVLNAEEDRPRVRGAAVTLGEMIRKVESAPETARRMRELKSNGQPARLANATAPVNNGG